LRNSPEERKIEQAIIQSANLNPNYTFENFVVGSCNQFAQAAAIAVAKNRRNRITRFSFMGVQAWGKPT